jgi:hypothetical protein
MRTAQTTADGTAGCESSSKGRAGGDCGTFLGGDILSFPFRGGAALLSANLGERGSRRTVVDAPLEDSGRSPRVDVGMLLVGREDSGVVLAMPTPLSMSAAQLHFWCRSATSCGRAMIQFGMWPTPRATQ